MSRGAPARHRPAHLEILPDAIVLRLESATADPAALRDTIAEMAKLSRRLRGETRRGPYR
jgi:hypothetical protein